MTVGQLRELIQVEAKFKGDAQLVGWLDATIAEEARAITAGVKFPDLFVPDYGTTLTAAQQTITLTDVQHIDLNSIRLYPEGEISRGYYLRRRPSALGINDGPARTFVFMATSIQIYPYADVAAGDILRFNYWRYPVNLSTLSDLLEIVPQTILPELKTRVIARALTFTETKQIPLYSGQIPMRRSETIAQTDLGKV